MMFIVLMILATNPFAAHETAGKLELNHFHDECGNPVYSQIIIYDYNETTANDEVRHWYLVTPQDGLDAYPIYCSGSDRWAVRWLDKEQSLDRKITSSVYQETWTQTDPERANKKILDERNRVQLIKREYNPSPHKLPVE